MRPTPTTENLLPPYFIRPSAKKNCAVARSKHTKPAPTPSTPFGETHKSNLGITVANGKYCPLTPGDAPQDALRYGQFPFDFSDML
jgi:hypothetical protein